MTFDPYNALSLGYFIFSVCFFLFLARKTKKLDQQEYVTAINAINLVTVTFKDTRYRIAKEQVSKKYASQTSATGGNIESPSFRKESQELITQSVKDVVRLLSGNVYRTLLKYYSEDGIGLLIIETLQK